MSNLHLTTLRPHVADAALAAEIDALSKAPELRPVILAEPDKQSQIHPYDCWAAGTASLLNTTRGTRHTYATIKALPGDWQGEGDSSLPEEHFGGFFKSLGLNPWRRSEKLTYEYLWSLLASHGHALLMYQSDGELGHTVVVWKVGVDAQGKPDGASLTVWDPHDKAHWTHRIDSVPAPMYLAN
jgi:hypothetical protein